MNKIEGMTLVYFGRNKTEADRIRDVWLDNGRATLNLTIRKTLFSRRRYYVYVTD